jgi:3-mercaptopyruvate sulfurtransferase SseA
MTLPESANTRCPAVASQLAYALRDLLELDMIDARSEDRFEAVVAANRALAVYSTLDRSF